MRLVHFAVARVLCSREALSVGTHVERPEQETSDVVVIFFRPIASSFAL